MLALELMWLATLGGWPWRTALYRLLPGALMIVALRGGLTDAAWPWIALPLALSFPAHLADLRQRPR